MDWIKDEINIATTDEEKEHVTMLCEKGVKDYLSNCIIYILLNFLQISNVIKTFQDRILQDKKKYSILTGFYFIEKQIHIKF